jgi:hypothetical protein
VVDRRCEQVLCDAPLGALAVQLAGQRRVVGGQVAQEDGQAAGRQVAAVPVEQVDPVVAEEVGFYRLGVVLDQDAEAQPSPRDRPVCSP